ncbi:MAG: hypothetical protein IKZ45_08035 [Fibrobacter sp.]|nr:hypothetical protein [Fibrobacter sp.]
MQDSRGPRAVTTNQEGIFENLEKVVRKYALSSYLRPIADHTREAFAQAVAFVEKFYSSAEPSVGNGTAYKVILDSGCGTGESTVNIALAHPGIPVIGIDKSVARLSKAGSSTTPPNAFHIRAELLDFWRLALDEVTAGRWQIPYHALYYPNPWPKQSEATRRFHLHPIFPTFLQLGETIELRTNWEIYAREFAMAAGVSSGGDNDGGRDDDAGNKTPRAISCEAFQPEQPITAFERKYNEARQQLWRVVITK